MDLAELDYENITERDEKLKDRDKYIQQCFKDKIQLVITGVAFLNIKIIELPPAYIVYINMFDPEGSKCFLEYQNLIKYAIKIIEGAKLPCYQCYKYFKREFKFIKKWLDE